MKSFIFLITTGLLLSVQIESISKDSNRQTHELKKEEKAEFVDYLSFDHPSEKSLLKYKKSEQHNYAYLSKYLRAIRNELPKELKPQLNFVNYWIKRLKCVIFRKPFTEKRYVDYIWSIWLQGTNDAPRLVKNCWRSVEKYRGNRKFIVLDENTIPQYVTLPQYIWDKYRSNKIPPALFADIVRYCLLYKYGGTWIDATVIMTAPIPDKITSLKFFMFNIPKKMFQRELHLTANWFIHAQPGNPILKDLINLCFEYWKYENKNVSYFMNYTLFTLVVTYDPEAYQVFKNMPYYPEKLPFYPILRRKYSKELIYNALKYDDLPIHKLTYKLQKKYIGSLFEHLSQENAELLE